MAAEQGGDARAVAGKRNRSNVETGHGFHQFANNVRHAAWAGGSHLHLTRMGLGIFNQFLEAGPWLVSVGDDGDLAAGHNGDWEEIVIAELGEAENAVILWVLGAEQQGVAVGFIAVDELGSDGAGTAPAY